MRFEFAALGEGDKPAPRGGERGLVEGNFPRGEAAESLSDVSHVSERMTKFFDFGIQPTLAAAMAGQVRLKQRFGIHLGSALLAFDGFKIRPRERYDLRIIW